MMYENAVTRCENLFVRLYDKSNYNNFRIALDFATRAFERISMNNPAFYAENFYLRVINCEDKLISTVCEYYLEGKGLKENLTEDIFPIIHALSGCKNNETTKELRQLFLEVYN